MKRTPRKILMEEHPFRTAAMLASIGIGTREIARRTDLSHGQIGYRLGVYKQITGMEKGLRVTWREGNSPLLRKVLADVQGIMRLEWQRKFLPLLVHPTPQTVKEKQRKPMTADNLPKNWGKVL